MGSFCCFLRNSLSKVHHLNNSLDKAIEFYHLALARTATEDMFTSDMLKRALEEFQVSFK